MEKSYIVDCRYYSESFDGAIFDGPFRLYFAQYQEQTALELFHHFTTTFKSYSKEIKKLYKVRKRMAYFFMYPNHAEKQLKQPKGDLEKIFITPFGFDYVVGFNSEEVKHAIVLFEPYLSFICKNWVMGENQIIHDNFKKDFLLHLS